MRLEIRNRIYDFATEPQSDWQIGNSNFLHLTQTCRQIRTEYRPIWMANATVSLGEGEIFKYLNIFFSGWISANGEQYRGNISVNHVRKWTAFNYPFLEIMGRFMSISLIRISTAHSAMSNADEEIRCQFSEEMTSIFSRRLSWINRVQGDCRSFLFNNKDWPMFILNMRETFEATWLDGLGCIEEAKAVEFLKGLGYSSWGRASLPVHLGVHSKGLLGGLCCHGLRDFG